MLRNLRAQLATMHSLNDDLYAALERARTEVEVWRSAYDSAVKDRDWYREAAKNVGIRAVS